MLKSYLWPLALMCGVSLAGRSPADEPKKSESAVPAADTEQKALEQLRGAWDVVKWAGPFFETRRLVFDGAKVTVVWLEGQGREALKKKEYELKIKVDPTAKPMRIDFVVGDAAGPGIYELSGDTLRVCFPAKGTKRPTEFTAWDDVTFATLKRVRESDPIKEPVADDFLTNVTPLGKVELKAGFAADPHTKTIEFPGGPGKTTLGGVTAGVGMYYQLEYTAADAPLTFRVESKQDTTLLIKLPDGTWIADDNSGGGFNPLIRIAKPTSGSYAIFVGIADPDVFPRKTPASDATLFITGKEVKPAGGAAGSLVDEPKKSDTTTATKGRLTASGPAGVFFMVRYANGAVEKAAWYFQADGTVYQNPVQGLSPDDLKAHKGPKGRFQFADNKMAITWADGKVARTEVERDEKGPTFMWDLGIFIPAEPVTDAKQIIGVYEGADTLAVKDKVARPVFVNQSIEFRADGTYQRGKATGASVWGTDAGTWKAEGYSITLTDQEGKTLRVILIPATTDPDLKQQPDHLYMGGMLLRKMQK